MAVRKRDQWIERVKAVELEYRAAVFATGVLRDRLRAEPHALPPGLGHADVNQMAGNLEATYLVRLFAVFESGLREAWRVALRKRTVPQMEPLLNGFASARGVPDAVLQAAHQVREYRNVLVHEGTGLSTPMIPLAEGRRRLTRFFSFLPPDW